jgi:hypothetical protein
MPYQIDQSIKIENTSKPTYIALTNGTQIVCSISVKDKRVLKKYFRALNKPLLFKLFTFSVICTKAIDVLKPNLVYIDREYVSHERNIKSIILLIFRLHDQDLPIIRFTEIGKSSPAHLKAYQAMKSKKSDKKISSAEVIKLYEKTKRSGAL